MKILCCRKGKRGDVRFDIQFPVSGTEIQSNQYHEEVLQETLSRCWRIWQRDHPQTRHHEDKDKDRGPNNLRTVILQIIRGLQEHRVRGTIPQRIILSHHSLHPKELKKLKYRRTINHLENNMIHELIPAFVVINIHKPTP